MAMASMLDWAVGTVVDALMDSGGRNLNKFVFAAIQAEFQRPVHPLCVALLQDCTITRLSFTPATMGHSESSFRRLLSHNTQCP